MRENRTRPHKATAWTSLCWPPAAQMSRWINPPTRCGTFLPLQPGGSVLRHFLSSADVFVHFPKALSPHRGRHMPDRQPSNAATTHGGENVFFTCACSLEIVQERFEQLHHNGLIFLLEQDPKSEVKHILRGHDHNCQVISCHLWQKKWKMIFKWLISSSEQ